MNTMDFGKLHVMAGVRFEGTQMDTLGYNVTLYPAGSQNCALATGCGVPVPARNNPSYVDALPSVSLRYALDNESGLRLVYGRGVARPDAYQLVPYITEDDSTNPATVGLGNPALKPEHANNYDLLYERYLNPAGILQAGFFAKQLSGTLISTSYTSDERPLPGRPGFAVAQREQRRPIRLRGVLPAASLPAAGPAEWPRRDGQLQLDWLQGLPHPRPSR